MHARRKPFRHWILIETLWFKQRDRHHHHPRLRKFYSANYVQPQNGGLAREIDALACMDSAPSSDVYIALLKACSKAKLYDFVKQVHLHLCQHKVSLSGVLGDQLVAALAKCGAVDDAHQVLLLLASGSALSWSAVISAYLDRGSKHDAILAYSHMKNVGVSPTHHILVSLLKICNSVLAIEEARELHADAWAHGFAANAFVGSTLIHSYGKCGSILEAEKVFDELCTRNIVTWNAMLSAYIEQGQGVKALYLYRQLCEEGLCSTQRTFVVTLQACVSLIEQEKASSVIEGKSVLEIGRTLHADARKRDFGTDIYIGSTLLSIYSKCKSFGEAYNLFDGLQGLDVVNWSAMMSAYVDQLQGKEALQLYRQMVEEGLLVTAPTIIVGLQACCALPERDDVALEIGKALHKEAQRQGYTSNSFVCSTLISMYGQCGKIGEAEDLFVELPFRDTGTWNSLLSAYIEQDQHKKALCLYRQMLEEAVNPNQCTVVTGLQACCKELEDQSPNTAFVEVAKALHAYARRTGLISDVLIGSALVSTYVKLGCIMEAENTCYDLAYHNIISWNVMLLLYITHGHGDKALQLYRQIHLEGFSPSQHSFVLLPQACELLADLGDEFKTVALEIGKAIHADAQEAGFACDSYVASSFISMYGKCEGISLAETVFNDTFNRDAVSWSAILSIYAEQRDGKKCLQLYRQMCEERMSFSQQAIMATLHACSILAGKEEQLHTEEFSKMSCLEIVKGLHSDAKKIGILEAIQNTLIEVYAKCGSISLAENTFDHLPHHEVGSWNSLLTAYVEHGNGERALQCFRQMQEEGIEPNQHMLMMALQACTALLGTAIANGDEDTVGKVTVSIVQALHADAMSSCLEREVVFFNTLINLYSKCESLTEAEDMFDHLTCRDEVSWNVMLSGYYLQGRLEEVLLLFRQMQEEVIHASQQACLITIQACGSLVEKGEVSVNNDHPIKLMALEIGQTLHGTVRRSGFHDDVFIASALVNMYGKCGSLLDVVNVFDGLLDADEVVWNAMISAYVEHSKEVKALQFYAQMHEEGIESKQPMFVVAISACNLLADKHGWNISGHACEFLALQIGESLHEDITKKGLSSDPYIINNLISMYGKCGALARAENLFEALCCMDVVLWDTMICAYLGQSQWHKTFPLYRQMLDEGLKPSECTYTLMIQACGCIATDEETTWQGIPSKSLAMEIAYAFHADAKKSGFTSSSMVVGSLLTMCGKCGEVIQARKLFDTMRILDDVSLMNVMLSLYIEHGQESMALELFQKLQEEVALVNSLTFLLVLQACIGSTNLEMCKQVHAHVISLGYDIHSFVASTLIRAYASCATMADAHTVLEGLRCPDAVSWNACISGYAHEGNIIEVSQMLEEMYLRGLAIDNVTLVSLLSACSHAGVVAKGIDYYEPMNWDHGIAADWSHHLAMMDLLGRAGCLGWLGESMLCGLPMEVDESVSLTLLGACRLHGNIELGKQVFDHVVSWNPNECTAYILLSNMYAESEIQKYATCVF